MPLPQRTSSYHSAGSPQTVRDWDGGLTGFGGDEVYEPRRKVNRSMSGDMQRAMKSLEYSEADLELLMADSRQFAVLKQSLRNKGAITNEVLKQKLPLYIKYKKDRLAQTHPEVVDAMRRMPNRTRSGGRMERAERQSIVKPMNRLLTEEEVYEAEQPDGVLGSLGLGRIMRPAARKGTPKRAASLGAPRLTPKRTTSGDSASTFSAFGNSSLKDFATGFLSGGGGSAEDAADAEE
jgi:hypothetical protein